MKALVLTPDYPPGQGGIQNLAHRVVGGMEQVSVRVVTLDAPGARDFDRGEAARVHRVRSAGRRRSAAITALNARGVIEGLRYRPHVVLSMHIVTSPAAAVIRPLVGAPVVQYLHGLELGTRPRLAATAIRRADATIVVSSHTQRLALNAGGDLKRLHRIPPGVDIPEHRDTRSTRPTVVTIARLVNRYKGHDVMTRALPLIRARVPDVEWVVVGDGPLRTDLERWITERSLDGVVRLVGSVSDAERDAWLDRAHVFAMPSRLPPSEVGGEGFGMAFLEAAAHELPVVAGNVGGALDAVVDGETGLLVDPTDHVAVADAIIGLLMDRERAEALGRRGATRAREFAWPRISRAVEDLLIGLAAGRPRRRSGA